MADMFMMGSVVVGVINATLAAALLVVYGTVYGKARSAFTLALLTFAAAFLLQNLLVIYSYVTMMPLMPPTLSPYLFGIAAFEASGLGAMVWTATR